METTGPNNDMAKAKNSEATQAMQQRLEQNKLKQLALNKAMHKTKNALDKVQTEIEALKNNGSRP
jgi:predicted  nucleic acid-binding Zn-ribbon protein